MIIIVVGTFSYCSNALRCSIGECNWWERQTMYVVHVYCTVHTFNVVLERTLPAGGAVSNALPRDIMHFTHGAFRVCATDIRTPRMFALNFISISLNIYYIYDLSCSCRENQCYVIFMNVLL